MPASRRGPKEPEFGALKRDAVPVQVIGMIKEMILTGELRPGQALPPQRELATRLGVSRPTLREAVRALTVMNILESRQGDGSYVTSLDPALLAGPIDFVLAVDDTAILSLFEVRMLLETYCASVAATTMSAEELDELDHLVSSETHVGDQKKLSESDLAFHAAIIQGTHNPILMSLALTVSQLAIESRRRTAKLPSMHGLTATHHRRIVEALRARDAEKAREAMAFHLESVANAYREFLSQREAGEPAPAGEGDAPSTRRSRTKVAS